MMKGFAVRSLISEFSYGFALTHELVLSLGSLKAAPIFPSLIEEGRTGGGYDVKLDAPGLPLFLQFKRSERLSRGTAREIKAGAPLSPPYYRMALTARKDSDQHDMLIALDRSPNLVFYAAPLFHRKEEFDEAFLKGQVRARSFFVSPAKIGKFNDNDAHHISFDGKTCVVMSEPRIVTALGASELAGLLLERLVAEERPLSATITEAIVAAERAQELGHQPAQSSDVDYKLLVQTVEAPGSQTGVDVFIGRQAEALPSSGISPPRNPEMEPLRRLAGIGLREFNAQLYIVQQTEKPLEP